MFLQDFFVDFWIYDLRLTEPAHAFKYNTKWKYFNYYNQKKLLVRALTFRLSHKKL